VDGAGGWELGFFPLMRLVLLSILVLHNYTPLAPMLAAGDACLANLIFFLIWDFEETAPIRLPSYIETRY
jgi:hypothetical protein